MLWQYHALPKDPNYRHPVNFHASNSTSTLTTTSQPRGTSTRAQQFPPVQQFPVRANANQQLSQIHVQQSNISTPYVVCAPSMTRRHFQVVQYLSQTPQPPHNIAQPNVNSLQQQTRFVLQPPRLILREPQIDPRRQFERQNDEENRREQLYKRRSSTSPARKQTRKTTP